MEHLCNLAGTFAQMTFVFCLVFFFLEDQIVLLYPHPSTGAHFSFTSIYCTGAIKIYNKSFPPYKILLNFLFHITTESSTQKRHSALERSRGFMREGLPLWLASITLRKPKPRWGGVSVTPAALLFLSHSSPLFGISQTSLQPPSFKKEKKTQQHISFQLW